MIKGSPAKYSSMDSPRDGMRREILPPSTPKLEKLGYATRSLVAVPLLYRRNRPLGVFEVLNHRQGKFSVEARTVLLIARHAAAAVENTQHIAALIKSRDRLVKSASESL